MKRPREDAAAGSRKKYKSRLFGTMQLPRSRVRSSRVARIELKELVVFSGSSVQIGSGRADCLNLVPQGPDFNERIGRHINLEGVDVNYIAKGPTGGSAGGDQFIMVALVWDSQPNGSAASAGTIFDLGTITNGVLGFKNTAQYRDRFSILWQERITLQPTANGDGNYTNSYWRKHYNLKNPMYQCEYTSASAAVPSTGALYLVQLCNVTTSDANAPTVEFGTKLIFTDM